MDNYSIAFDDAREFVLSKFNTEGTLEEAISKATVAYYEACIPEHVTIARGSKTTVEREDGMMVQVQAVADSYASLTIPKKSPTLSLVAHVANLNRDIGGDIILTSQATLLTLSVAIEELGLEGIAAQMHSHSEDAYKKGLALIDDGQETDIEGDIETLRKLGTSYMESLELIRP